MKFPYIFWHRTIALKTSKRITIAKKANNLLLNLAQANFSNHSWFYATQHRLNSTGIEKTDIKIRNCLLKRLKDVFHQEAHLDINRDNSKLRTYREIKTNLGMEKYLLCPMNCKERIALTKLRLSNHLLMIETGRHSNLGILQRFCPFCPNTIESEQHFILDCKIYSTIREELFQEVLPNFPLFNLLSEREKFITLMSVESVIQHTARFTYKAFEIRSFLVNQPKNYD